MSKTTSDSMIVNDKAKKKFVNDKGTWFLCGKTCDYHILMCLNHNDKVDVNPDCHGLLVKNSSVFLVVVSNDGYCEHSELNSNYAIGSGEDFAIAAMDFGRTAKEAVQYTKTRDAYTGGAVRVFKVDK